MARYFSNLFPTSFEIPTSHLRRAAGGFQPNTGGRFSNPMSNLWDQYTGILEEIKKKAVLLSG
jgi:hypothetical protein